MPLNVSFREFWRSLYAVMRMHSPLVDRVVYWIWSDDCMLRDSCSRSVGQIRPMESAPDMAVAPCWRNVATVVDRAVMRVTANWRVWRHNERKLWLAEDRLRQQLRNTWIGCESYAATTVCRKTHTEKHEKSTTIMIRTGRGMPPR